jgi:peroxiredoxin
MRKNLCILFAVIAVTAYGQNKIFTLKGKIGNLNAPAKIYFEHSENGNNKVDSASLKNGVFTFQGKTNEPAAARIIVDYKGEGVKIATSKGDWRLFYIDGQNITLESNDATLDNIVFINSPINASHKAYLDEIGGSAQDISKKVGAKYAAATSEQQNDTAFVNSLNKEYRNAFAEMWRKQFEYARKNPNSYFSLVALSEAAGSNVEVAKVEPLFLALNANIKKTSEGIAFAKRIEAAKTTNVGQKAPVFAQNDVNNKPVKLSDFKGKYVLLDFWASWCSPCRAENPNLVKAYAKYKAKGFEILGVSLDQTSSKQAWIAAVKKDGLTWTNISDLKGWNNEAALLYGVRAVPQNYLIDPTGVIVAKNLRGKELEEKLKTIFGD